MFHYQFLLYLKPFLNLLYQGLVSDEFLPTLFVLNEDGTLSPWLVEHTNQNTFMISSDKIMTLADPRPTLLEKYENLIK